MSSYIAFSVKANINLIVHFSQTFYSQCNIRDQSHSHYNAALAYTRIGERVFKGIKNACYTAPIFLFCGKSCCWHSTRLVWTMHSLFFYCCCKYL